MSGRQEFPTSLFKIDIFACATKNSRGFVVNFGVLVRVAIDVADVKLSCLCATNSLNEEM